jgi:class 3 adenylate cyclase
MWEERRTVTVLFADMVGFTARAERLDPEDVLAVQTEYFGIVRQVVRRWGGVVEKYVGDAVLAVFGAPLSAEDDAYRAVRAGLEIPVALTGVQLPDAAPVRVRVGIATGEAVVNLTTVHDGGQAFVSGDVVNTASRAQAATAAGLVAVTAATREVTRHRIRYAGPAAVTVAGKAHALEIWHALGAATGPSDVDDSDRERRLVSAQLDRLDPVDRTALYAAAVVVDTVGPAGVTPAAVGATAGTDPVRARAALDRLVRVELLETDPALGGYAFESPVVLRVAAARLTRRGRAGFAERLDLWLTDRGEAVVDTGWGARMCARPGMRRRPGRRPHAIH